MVADPTPLLVSEHRFVRDPSGRTWTKTQCDYDSWRPYIEAFGSLKILARVAQIPYPPGDHRRADGEDVVIEGLPHYVGPIQFVGALPETLWRISVSIRSIPLVIFRGPGALSLAAWPFVLALRVPYGVEVLGDNEAVFREGGVGGRLGRIYASIFYLFQRQACWKASAVSYVTGKTLQSKYPNSRAEEFTVTLSSLPDHAVLKKPRKYSGTGTLRAILVGSLDQPYKGVDVALRALRAMPPTRRAHLTVLGEGRLRLEYEALVSQLGLTDNVRFVGTVASVDDVIEHLDAADILIMPSRTEGMPRALIEAMGRALPALASRVGGIPELLDDSFMFPPGDSLALARLLEDMSPELLTEMSADNLRRAQDFSSRRLDELQARFLGRLSDLSHRLTPPAPSSEATAS